jgi:hypothetical protein
VLAATIIYGKEQRQVGNACVITLKPSNWGLLVQLAQDKQLEMVREDACVKRIVFGKITHALPAITAGMQSYCRMGTALYVEQKAHALQLKPTIIAKNAPVAIICSFGILMGIAIAAKDLL